MDHSPLPMEANVVLDDGGCIVGADAAARAWFGATEAMRLEEVLPGGGLAEAHRQVIDGAATVAVEIAIGSEPAGTRLQVRLRRLDGPGPPQVLATIARDPLEAALDPLTGLPDRRAIAAQVEHWQRSSGAASPRFAVLFLDLVDFKRINDRHTHQGGDMVLASIAKRLPACVRQGDLVARYGGDEFVVLLKDVATAEDAAPIVSRLRACCCERHDLYGYPVGVDATIGVALSGESPRPIEELIAEADRDMYARKKTGGSRPETGGWRLEAGVGAAGVIGTLQRSGAGLGPSASHSAATDRRAGVEWASEPPLVELADVSLEYDNGVVAVEGFDMQLGAGEFVSLLGPSGCGKSTVLRLVAGLSRPTRGVVRRSWDGAVRSGATEPPLGCVFQEPTLLPWATVWKNVYLPLRLRGVSRQAAVPRVDEALALTGLKAFAGAYPRELSGGMKMRAAVARALVAQPRLLLLDEPFAALDEITRQRLNDDLLALRRRQGWSALFITHSVFEAAYLSTRVLVLSSRPGRVVADVAIDLPAERTSATRTTPRYGELCGQLSAALAATASAEEPRYA